MTATRWARRRLTAAGVLVACSVALAACGGGSGSDDPQVLEAGQVDIKLPDGFKVVNGKAVAPAEATNAAASTDSTPSAGSPGDAQAKPSTSGTTIPLDDKQDPTTALLASFGKFRACLDDEGVKFVGAPDPSKPESPTNDPNYLKSLSTCAARSGILQALKDAQGQEADLSPDEIEQRNKGYLKWRECMVGRGWKIPKPTPDAQGRLFSFGGGSMPQLTAPDGKDIFTSNDIQDCAAKAQKAVGG